VYAETKSLVLACRHAERQTGPKTRAQIKEKTCRGHASPEAFHLQVREREKDRESLLGTVLPSTPKTTKHWGKGEHLRFCVSVVYCDFVPLELSGLKT